MNKVYLVGAGPGDPELITLKGRRVLGLADVVLHDHLANTDLLKLAPPAAERIYVGKKKAVHAATQEEICALMIERARRGLSVVRLKGGDPFIFGRGGEEAEALADAGIPFEIVPGVTTPLGIAASTGVPLTHRDHTSIVTFVTGHDISLIDWKAVAAAPTLVIFMGLTNISEITAALIAAGRSAETPAMTVRWATRPDQEVVTGTLGTLADLTHAAGMKPPATIIAGGVVSLREKLSWFERLPLFGQRIIVTRAREQADSLANPLRRLGAEVIELPAIEIRPASDYSALDNAILQIGDYDWLIFTSVNGVRFFLERLDQTAIDLRAIRGRICAIGPATRDALTRLHLKVDVTADEYVAEGLLAKLTAWNLTGARILISRAAVARDVLPTELTRLGAAVDVVEAYRTEAPTDLALHAAAAFARRPHWITFTSSSTVTNLMNAIGKLPDGIRTASIGPVTTGTLRSFSLQTDVEARVFTADGLVESLTAASIIGK
jgi:uroporphyrinogen III methyltransferase/synthase